MSFGTKRVRTLTREQVRELDRRSIEEFGVPSALLMENAGRACADVAVQMLEDAGHKSALVLCGPGNNGGDGFVIARSLRNRGFEVELSYLGEVSELSKASDDVQLFARLWRGVGGTIGSLGSDESFESLEANLGKAGLVIDSLFGTGLTRDLDAPLIGLVEALAASGRPTLAVDIPSGLDANTGEIHGGAVEATKTVTFVAAKPGFELDQGPSLCGEVVVAEIGLPGWLVEAAFRERERS
ncbi:MAG: hydroxyethylthiazole kinase-like uncharacterized protein yjeF [Planctomycetota bacterium]|jgi:hydroxyethylthiazole kinase-like uncharacterized protein yjeF